MGEIQCGETIRHSRDSPCESVRAFSSPNSPTEKNTQTGLSPIVTSNLERLFFMSQNDAARNPMREARRRGRTMKNNTVVKSRSVPVRKTVRIQPSTRKKKEMARARRK